MTNTDEQRLREKQMTSVFILYLHFPPLNPHEKSMPHRLWIQLFMPFRNYICNYNLSDIAFCCFSDNKCTKFYGPEPNSLLNLATCEHDTCKCALGINWVKLEIPCNFLGGKRCPIAIYTLNVTNLQTSVHKLLTNCIRTACFIFFVQVVGRNLEQAVNNF